MSCGNKSEVPCILLKLNQKIFAKAIDKVVFQVQGKSSISKLHFVKIVINIIFANILLL
jgi:hypothetical protein